MAETLTFFVPGLPVPQGSMNVSEDGHVYHKQPGLAKWRNTVGFFAERAMRQRGWELPLNEPLEVRVYFYLPKPKRAKWWWPAVKPDLDKLTRAIGDALSPKRGSKALFEDSRIVKWRQSKYYAADGATGVAVTLVRDPEPQTQRFSPNWFKQALERQIFQGVIAE